ncbi:MAG: hypothetical protein IJH17_08095, partial [Clostridia bacterium]|nr:hypothetical protein [Clostridia bacterium]
SVTKPDHYKDTDWSDSNGGTASDNTYSFTAAAGTEYEVKADVNTYSGVNLTLANDGSGTPDATTPFAIVGTKADGTTTYNVSITGGTATVYGDEKYVVTAKAANGNYVSAFAGDGTSQSPADLTTAKPNSATVNIDNPTSNKTVTATITARTAPTISGDMQFRKGEGDTSDRVFTITMNDYTSLTVTPTSGGAGNKATDNSTYTVSAATLEALTGSADGTNYEYTFDFGEGKTLTGKITVFSSAEVSDVIAPTTSFKHGDAFSLEGLSFKYGPTGSQTTYTYTGGAWNNTLPSDVEFAIGDKTGMSASDLATYAASAITRHDTKGGAAVVNNGETVTVTVGTKSGTSSAITVGTKALTLTASNASLDKVYDGDAVATETITVSDFSNQLVTLDGGSSSTKDTVTFTSATGTYNVSTIPSATAGTGKTVKFSNVTLSGADAGNYTATINDFSGAAINKRTIRISTLWTDKHAQQGVSAFLLAKTDGAATLAANSATTTLASHSGTNNDINQVITL